MREIIFRGKNIKGKWVYGDLLRNRGETFIAPDGIADPLATAEDFQVDPETVGQYTGLKDKNGKEIYEGDIVNCDISAAFGEKEIWGVKGAVTFSLGFFQVYDYMISFTTNRTVLGNIHDNPELLKPNNK